MRIWWFAVVLSSWCWVGCGGVIEDPDLAETAEESEAPSSDPSSDPPSTAECEAAPEWAGELEVGTGEDCFAGVEDGDVVPLIGGPQGGFHIWLGVRCRDCGGATPATYGLRDPATGDLIWGAAQSAVLELDKVEGYRQGAGIIAYVPGDDWDQQPGTGIDYVGQALTLYVEVEIGGAVHVSERTVTVGDVEFVASDCPDCN